MVLVAVWLFPDLPPCFLLWGRWFGAGLGLSKFNHLGAAAQGAKARERLHGRPCGHIWKHDPHQVRRGVEQLREAALPAGMNGPRQSLAQILVCDENWMLAARWHDESNLLALLNCA